MRPAAASKLHTSPVKARALDLGIPVHQPVSFRIPSACETLEELRLDALVVVAYGLILPAAALLAPTLGCFNIHASLLPRWRGAAPIQRAILAGDATPASASCAWRRGSTPARSSRPTLSRSIRSTPARRSTTGSPCWAASSSCLTIDALAAGRAIETPQPEDGVTYAEKISKAEALIDWREDAEQVLRKVRAFNPAPIAETRWNGEQLRIWQARASTGPAPSGAAPAAPGTVMAASPDGITVACGRGVLDIGRLQLAGRKSVTAAEFLRAHSLAGSRFA